MPKVTKPQTFDRLDILIDDCLSMTIWQLEFIESCAKRKDEGKYFSQKQLDIINEIFETYMI